MWLHTLLQQSTLISTDSCTRSQYAQKKKLHASLISEACQSQLVWLTITIQFRDTYTHSKSISQTKTLTRWSHSRYELRGTQMFTVALCSNNQTYVYMHYIRCCWLDTENDDWIDTVCKQYIWSWQRTVDNIACEQIWIDLKNVWLTIQ